MSEINKPSDHSDIDLVLHQACRAATKLVLCSKMAPMCRSRRAVEDKFQRNNREAEGKFHAVRMREIGKLAELRPTLVPELESHGIDSSSLFEPALFVSYAIEEDARRMSCAFEKIFLMLSRCIALRKSKIDDSTTPLLLTDTELEVWNILEGKIFMSKKIAKLVYDNDYTKESNIRQFIQKMRRKGCVISNVRGRGYYRPDAPPPDVKIPA